MVDIHTHLLPEIDDGSPSMDASIEMVKGEIANGIKYAIITPHALRKEMEPYTLERLRNDFLEFKTKIESELPIKLYLGQEVYKSDDLIHNLKNKQVLTLNDSEYVLLELPYQEAPQDLDEIIYACEILGLKIIFAHIERYSYLSIKDIENLKKTGVLFQVNSSSFYSRHKYVRKRVHKLFKKKLVSFIASDIHSYRTNTMKEAFELVKSKYGEKTANEVFFENAKNLLNIG